SGGTLCWSCWRLTVLPPGRGTLGDVSGKRIASSCCGPLMTTVSEWMTSPRGPSTRNSCTPSRADRNSKLPSPFTGTLSPRPPPFLPNSTVYPPPTGGRVEISPRIVNTRPRSSSCPGVVLARSAPITATKKRGFILLLHAASGHAATDCQDEARFPVAQFLGFTVARDFLNCAVVVCGRCTGRKLMRRPDQRRILS